MSEIMADCPNCGHAFKSFFTFAGTATIRMSGNKERCPKCGGRANTRDGEYKLVDSIVQSFRAASEEELKRFSEVAAAAAEGRISDREAKARAGAINPRFATIMERAMQWGIPALIVAIIGLWPAFKQANSSQPDGAALLTELRRAHATNEQILEQIRQLNEHESAAERPPPASPTTPPSNR